MLHRLKTRPPHETPYMTVNIDDAPPTQSKKHCLRGSPASSNCSKPHVAPCRGGPGRRRRGGGGAGGHGARRRWISPPSKGALGAAARPGCHRPPGGVIRPRRPGRQRRRGTPGRALPLAELPGRRAPTAPARLTGGLGLRLLAGLALTDRAVTRMSRRSEAVQPSSCRM